MDTYQTSTAMTPETPGSTRSRRSHPKSRSGCKTCKRRKIKCDERQPACGNCKKHGVECDFMSENGARLRMTVASDGPSKAMNVLDLELLHNFCTSTCATLTHHPLLRDVWRISAVQIALDCEFVLRSMLALSAMHLAHHRPEKRDYYEAEGALHHQIATRAAMTAMNTLTKENIRQLHLFSVLTMFYALGRPPREDDSLIIGESNFPDWMFLLKGTRQFSELLKEDIFGGPLGPIFRHGWRRARILQPDDEDRRLVPSQEIEVLHSLWRLVEGSVENDDERRKYRISIRALYPHYRMFLADLGGVGTEGDGEKSPSSNMTGADIEMEMGMRRGMVELTDAFMWVYRVSDNLLPYLRVPTQEAVAIFAYFLVLLNRVPDQWWVQGWAEHLISKVYGLLDAEHRLWIRWPIEQLGWLPPTAEIRS